MNIRYLTSRLTLEPNNEEKYVFLVPSVDLATNLLAAGYTAIAINEHTTTIRHFCESISEIQPGSTYVLKYVFALALSKKDNEVMKMFLKNEGLHWCEAWKIFYKKDYLSNFVNLEALKTDVETFIKNREYVCSELGLPVEVKSQLMYKNEYDSNGNLKAAKLLQAVRNFEIVLERDERFAGKIRFNDFSKQINLFGDVPWESINNYRAWGNNDDSALFSLIQADYALINRSDFFDAIKNVASKNRFHPIREILDDLKWDGQPYVKNLLPDYLGCEPSTYNYEVMKVFMTGAVARIYDPGCKFDYTMILQGSQGIGKSTFLRLLALNDNWFNDSLDSLDSDKAVQSLLGSWVIELAELKSLARTAGGVESVKRFLSATQDKFREPYQRRADIYQRQCVFAGTTNKSDYLQDETGNRRFLIIEVGIHKPTKSLFQASVMDDIKGAWAEIVHIWKTEHPALILPESCREEAKRMQDSATSDDGKRGIIEKYLETKDRVCAIEIWQEALGETGRPSKWQATEIGDIVSQIPGWKKLDKTARFGKYGPQKGFQRERTYKKSDDFMSIDELDDNELPFV